MRVKGLRVLQCHSELSPRREAAQQSQRHVPVSGGNPSGALTCAFNCGQLVGGAGRSVPGEKQSIVRAPTNARSRAYALNGRTIVWRHNLLPLGISANRARMLFPLLTADSGWTRRANNRSKSLVFQGIIDNHP